MASGFSMADFTGIPDLQTLASRYEAAAEQHRDWQKAETGLLGAKRDAERTLSEAMVKLPRHSIHDAVDVTWN